MVLGQKHGTNYLPYTDCQSRPKRMDVETWCAQNNLTKANYYYRLRRVREVCLEQVQGTAATAFVELPVPTT